MQKNRFAAIICLAVLAVIALVLAARMFIQLPAVQTEMRTTPTPMPYYGNVMQVTLDPNAPTPFPMLKNGSSGDTVTTLQTRLQQLGYYAGTIDGQFGPGTQTAVTLFQQQHGLDADGVVGPDTSSLLYSNQARPYISPTPAATFTPTAAPTATPTEVAVNTLKPMVDQKPFLRADGLPMLVNKTYPLPDDYRPYDLVDMSDYCDASVVKIKYKGTQAEREAVDALMIMLRAAIDEGISDWQISAAYRDVAYQQQLFNNKVKAYQKEGLSYSKAVAATRKSVADPGTSEHHIGLAFDITVPGKSFAGTKQAKWLAEHCWDYGFILRYTKEKEAITGFVAEAWHFRYVGMDHARIMHEKNLCLEEYIQEYGLLIEDE